LIENVRWAREKMPDAPAVLDLLADTSHQYGKARHLIEITGFFGCGKAHWTIPTIKIAIAV
jgi:hypothetical protein